MDCNGHSNDLAKETMSFPSVLFTAGHKKSRQKGGSQARIMEAK